MSDEGLAACSEGASPQEDAQADALEPLSSVDEKMEEQTNAEDKELPVVERVKKLPKSEKKRIKKEYQTKIRKVKRRDRRRRRRDAGKEERSKLLTEMTIEERREFILAEKEKEEADGAAMQNNMAMAKEHGMRVVFNCSFNDQMSPAELNSLGKQFQLCFHALKKSDPFVPLHFCLTSYDKESALHDRCLSFGFNSWNMDAHTEAYWDVFAAKDLVCLTPDAPESVEEFDPKKVYVIGGLVDRTVSKFHSINQATNQGVEVKKLPFKDYLPISMSTVLNVNTVVEIMIAWMQHKDWKKALQASLPKRKLNSQGRKSILKARRTERMELSHNKEDSASDSMCSSDESLARLQ
eukprot:Platyproteum_vivax@DN13058_c0_g1_i1.p1